MKRYLLFFILVTAMFRYSYGQADILIPKVNSAVYFDVTPPLLQMRMVAAEKSDDGSDEIQNKIGRKEFGNLKSNNFPLAEDEVWQKQDGTYLPKNAAPHQNFDGITNLSNVYPPDTQGDVSTDKYIQVVNLNFAIYTKTGTILMGPSSLSTIWAGIPAPWNGTNSGDPVVLYDQAADRWIITQFSIPNYTQMAELVAISATSDPTGVWYRYVFNFGTKLPDYPKFGIWNDGYYLAFNQFTNGPNWTWAGVGACALERTKMLAGDPTAAIVRFDLGTASDPHSMLPSDWDGANPPQANEPNYFSYFNDWSSPTDDVLKIWEFHVDWTTPANSTFAEVSSLVTSPFDADLCTAVRDRCIPQPGTSIKLESLADRLMYRLQYRNFGTHRSMVTNHTVDVDGSGHAGVRWYELRNSGSGWSIYQQGTYAPDANHRWVGSAAMNLMGDIALGYSVSNSTTVFPSIRYTGRHANDPLGQMTIAEQTIIDGSGSQTGSAARWGDYSMMSVDPTDDRTFWFTTEYVQVTGNVTWKTRIASFLFDNTPSVTTLQASSVTSATATMNGIINPNGLSTTYYFQHGTTTAYGNQTPAASAGSVPSNLSISAGLTGLPTGVPYHYRLVAENYYGTTNGLDMIVIPVNTAITTTAASAITQTGATSGGEILLDGGLTVTARGVCYGTSLNPDVSGSHTANGTGSGFFISPITGLLSNTTYHIRAYAVNSNGAYYGPDITFTTYCSSALLPFTESFSSASFPSCWTQQISAGGNSQWSVSPSANAGGTENEMRSAYQINPFPGTTRLVLPPLNTSGNTHLSLSFRHMLDSYSIGGLTLSVQSSSDGINWTDEAWSALTSSENISAVLVNTTVSNNLNNATTYLAFAITGDLYNYDYWYIDDVMITGVPILSTTPVSSVTANVATSGGNITSDGGLAVTARGVCWGASINPTTTGNHSTDGSGMGVFTSSITGLSPSTPYHIRAYAVNANGTAYGSDISFQTPCDAVSSFPWNEGFENSGLIPSCWSQEQVAGSGVNWVFITGDGYNNLVSAHGGTYNACLKDQTPADNKTRLISPPFNLALLSNPQLKFWHTQAIGFPDQDQLSVYYRTSYSGSWILLANYSNNITAWTEETLSLPDASGDYYIAFEGNAKFGYGVCIDDVQITGVPYLTTIQNITVPNGASSCFQATQTIVVAGGGTSFELQSGGSATMVAGQHILYYPGTFVHSGSYMHGYIAAGGPYCGAPPAMAEVISGEKEVQMEQKYPSFIKIFPNPTTGMFMLELTGIDPAEKVRVEIYGMKGEKILAKEITGRKLQEFSLSEAPSGLYFVRVYAQGKAETIKLVKF
ncbi:MAG: choice-of-anchor J domain-containing protein [Bacteroidetes bacterium]|nr:choice-of-anchor J domain-containing protein [Bacteroidota bacterium]